MPKRILIGKVVSDANDKTIIVLVERTYMHPKYQKTVKSSKRYVVHDPQNTYKEGDVVRIVESKPYSKTKRWHVVLNDTDCVEKENDTNAN